MAHSCPRCGDPVQRAYSSGAQLAAGLVGALFYAAFGNFECKNCGKIAHSEFSGLIRTRIMLTSLLMVAGAVVILILCLSLLSNSK